MIGEVSDSVSKLVRDEIELAKVEMLAKGRKLATGSVAGLVAGIFLVFALIAVLEGFAWLLWYLLPTGRTLNYFWGFFALGLILVVLGICAGLVAYRFLRAGSPPTPALAIDEARRIRETVASSTELPS